MIWLYLVRDVYFAEPGAGGTFTETFTFPTGGEWRAFGEIISPDRSRAVMEPIKIARKYKNGSGNEQHSFS